MHRSRRKKRILAASTGLAALVAVSAFAITASADDADPYPDPEGAALPTVVADTPAGQIRIPDPGELVVAGTVTYTAETSSQIVFRADSKAGEQECYIVVPRGRPADRGMLGCEDPQVIAKRGVHFIEIGRDRRMSGIVVLPAGATDVKATGDGVEVGDALVSINGSSGPVTVTADSPSGPYRETFSGGGEYYPMPGVDQHDELVP